MANEATSEELSAQWREHVESWRNSGQSQQRFCKKHNLSYAQFIYWRRRFEGKSRRARTQTASALVPVTCKVAISNPGLTLVLPSGLELRGLSQDNLTLALQLVERLS